MKVENTGHPFYTFYQNSTHKSIKEAEKFTKFSLFNIVEVEGGTPIVSIIQLFLTICVAKFSFCFKIGLNYHIKAQRYYIG